MRGLAPALFDEELRLRILAETGRSGTSGPVPNVGLRGDFAHAVNQALVAGAVVGVLVATAAGLFVALRVGGSLRRVGLATRRIAAGDYGVSVPVPPETELAAIAQDVNTLESALAEIEARRVRLLGEVAHEMRTPLAVIDAYAEGMLDGFIAPDQGVLTQLVAESRRLRRLSDDLSALSRAEEGRINLNLVSLDLRDVARDAAERLRPQAHDAHLTLEVGCGQEPIWVRADPDRIAQLVTNPIGNALRATPPGGVIRVACGYRADEVTLAISDTGEGLEPDQLDRVFERFYRVPGRRTAASESGSGIGLTIARSIARLHGGDVVASSPGAGLGATFTLTLPRITAASGNP